jgi:hypothetical protein
MFTGATPDSRKSVADYLKVARTALKRYISHKYTRGENTLSVYLLDPRAEGRLRQPEPLTSEELETVVDEVATELGMHSGSHFVVLTDDDVRPRLYAALRPSLPHVAVLSYAELSPDMNITPIARFNPPLEAYDESVFRLIASLPGNDAPLPELAGLQGNPALPAGLAGTGGHAPEQITDSLQARYPFEMEHPAAKHLVDVMWAGLLASMTAAELPRDSTLAKVIETVLRAPGVSASKIGKFVFTMAEAASAMVEENLAPAPADMALSAAAEAHDRLESGAHRLVQSFARDGFAARYKGVLA